MSNSRAQTKLRAKLLSLTAFGGAGRDRTDDLLLAKQALSQLSYSPLKRDPDISRNVLMMIGGPG